MDPFLSILAILLALFFGVQLLCLNAIYKDDDKKVLPKELPIISILLAARNEEKLILRNLRALENLNYPKERIQILIGDDNSSDSTAKLILDFIEGKKEFQYKLIKTNLGTGRGKANVLAHLAQDAKGEFFFITDVDVEVPADWVIGHLSAYNDDVGIVSGTTTCQRSGLFSRLQAIDWLHFMGYIKAFANLDMACTAVGNNMSVRASAYWETGGFEKLPFCITEDYKLFQAVTADGWGWKVLMNEQTLGKATHINNYGELLHQRKRWLIGAKELNWQWKSLFVLYAVFIPVLILLFLRDPMLGIGIWTIKFFFQSLFISALNRIVKNNRTSFVQLLLYEFFVMFNTTMSMLFFFLPIKNIWKGRLYTNNDLKDL